MLAFTRDRPKVPIRRGCESANRSGCAVAGTHAAKATAPSQDAGTRSAARAARTEAAQVTVPVGRRLTAPAAGLLRSYRPKQTPPEGHPAASGYGLGGLMSVGLERNFQPSSPGLSGRPMNTVVENISRTVFMGGRNKSGDDEGFGCWPRIQPPSSARVIALAPSLICASM